jgi:hypothetical protein
MGNVCSCNADWYASNCSVYCVPSQCTKQSSGNGACGNSGCECYENYFPATTCEVFCNVTECADMTHDRGVCSGNFL